jgi:F-type H+-transporting ATPase subunit a
VSSDLPPQPQPQPGAVDVVLDSAIEVATPGVQSNRRRNIGLLLLAILVIDIAAFFLIPPYPKDQPGQSITGIGDLITANLELPAPSTVWGEQPPAGAIVFSVPSISNTILTTWIVMLVTFALAFIATRRITMIPNRIQNALELAYESIENWAMSMGGNAATKHVPLFIAFFIFIVVSNWSGLIPLFGKVEFLRAPTSDVNVTIGLALVAFVYFHYQGFRALGARGYLGKFFVFSGFRQGIGAGFIDFFVGIIEFMLEFIKPVTLSMRLFGNIYGGEVALGVITALTIAIVPAAMLLLEGLLNLVQALIFSTLMLMYTLLAMEGHHAEEHPPADMEDALDPTHRPAVAGSAAGAAS